MPKTLERTLTGIAGFDGLIGGGIPKGSLVVLSGDPGSGKTIFCLQFIYDGLTKYGENASIVSLEESEAELLRTADVFGWDLRKFIEQGKLDIITVELYDFDKLRYAIEDSVQRVKAKRVVIDPGVVFRLYFERELDARKRILAMAKMLRSFGATTIITNEISLDKSSSLYGLEEYVADGVILLYHTRIDNKFVRNVAILKMRNTGISEKLHSVLLDEKGIRISTKEM